MRLADKVRRSGEKIVLEPMNRHERKIIHTALQDNNRIMTYSDGEEPYRKVVIAVRNN
jgi:spoIIIJ-associated protein